MQSNVDNWKQHQIATLEAIPGIVEDEFLDVVSEMVEPRLADIATTAPPRDNSEFIWSTNKAANDRARRTWFHLINTGQVRTDGPHYIRQGQPPYGLNVDVDRDENSIFMTIRSTWEKFSLVFGSVLSGRGQLPGHRNTRWQKVKPQLDELFFDVNVELINRLPKKIQALYKTGSRR